MMTRKTRELYDAVIDNIMSVYEEHYSDVYLNVERLMSDFEKPSNIPASRPSWDVNVLVAGSIIFGSKSFHYYGRPSG